MNAEHEPQNARRVAAQARLRTIRHAYDLVPDLRLKAERTGWLHLIQLADALIGATEALFEAERDVEAEIARGVSDPAEDAFLLRQVTLLDSTAEQVEAVLADG